MYERAVAQVPPGGEKRLWRRYIFLWLFYAAFEEVETKVGFARFSPCQCKAGRVKELTRPWIAYRTTLEREKSSRPPSSSSLIAPSPSPRSVSCSNFLHPQSRSSSSSLRLLSLSQLWVQYAYFELRQKDVQAAKKLLGAAIGLCPKEKLFKAYIELRTKLYEFDDVRTLYMKYLEFDPSNTAAWVKWAQLEAGLFDLDRARYLFDLGTTQELDMPEVLWKVRP